MEWRKESLYLEETKEFHLIQENIMSLLAWFLHECRSMSVNTANQTSDILRYPMNNTFIVDCSCVNTIATVSCAVNTCKPGGT